MTDAAIPVTSEEVSGYYAEAYEALHRKTCPRIVYNPEFKTFRFAGTDLTKGVKTEVFLRMADHLIERKSRGLM